MAEQKTAESRMQKAVDRLVTDYSEIRAGRANPNVLDKVMVDYYGTPTPINQVGSVSVAEARILVIQPWDKGLLNPIMKAIQASDIGINPQNDGNVIRLTFPQLTEERRKELAKGIAKRGEEAKVAIRSVLSPKRRRCSDWAAIHFLRSRYCTAVWKSSSSVTV